MRTHISILFPESSTSKTSAAGPAIVLDTSTALSNTTTITTTTITNIAPDTTLTVVTGTTSHTPPIILIFDSLPSGDFPQEHLIFQSPSHLSYSHYSDSSSHIEEIIVDNQTIFNLPKSDPIPPTQAEGALSSSHTFTPYLPIYSSFPDHTSVLSATMIAMVPSTPAPPLTSDEPIPPPTPPRVNHPLLLILPLLQLYLAFLLITKRGILQGILQVEVCDIFSFNLIVICLCPFLLVTSLLTC